jgi:hypothetical protein
MDQVLERQSAPETISEVEATLNYLVNDGVKIFTEAGGGGALDVRGGTIDPHHVVVHNGRPGAKDFVFEREGFRFVGHDTKVADFFDEDQVRRVYYPEMETLVKAESGASRVVVFDHTLRTADDAVGAQRLYRVVRSAARARPSAGGSGRSPSPSFRHRPSMAADPSPGRELSTRDLRRAYCLTRRSGNF